MGRLSRPSLFIMALFPFDTQCIEVHSIIQIFKNSSAAPNKSSSITDLFVLSETMKRCYILFDFLQSLCLKFENLDVIASELRMVGLQGQLGPCELRPHQLKELLHRVQLLLTFPLLRMIS